MKQSTKRLVASVAVVAALGAACGDDDGNDNASGATTTTEQSTSSTMAADAGIDSPASELRARRLPDRVRRLHRQRQRR
jgi:hypothetical protein